MIEETPPTLGARLKKARKAAEMNQNPLGEAVGITGAAISAIERGETLDIAVGRVEALARELRVSPVWLAFGIRPADVPQVRDVSLLDAKALADILEVVLQVAARGGWSTTPERLVNFVVKRYQEAAFQETEINREEIEKILSYF